MKTRPHTRPTAAQREARRTDFVRAATLTATIWLLLSVLSWLLTGCAATPAGPTAEQRAEHAMPAR